MNQDELADSLRHVEMQEVEEGREKAETPSNIKLLQTDLLVLIDGPCSNVSRKQINLKALQLTQFRLNVPASCRQKVIRKNWEKDNITEKWNNSTWAKKIASREKRETLTDFDRFKLMKAKQARNRLINVEFGKLRKAMKKSGGKKK